MGQLHLCRICGHDRFYHTGLGPCKRTQEPTALNPMRAACMCNEYRPITPEEEMSELDKAVDEVLLDIRGYHASLISFGQVEQSVWRLIAKALKLQGEVTP